MKVISHFPFQYKAAQSLSCVVVEEAGAFISSSSSFCVCGSAARTPWTTAQAAPGTVEWPCVLFTQTDNQTESLSWDGCRNRHKTLRSVHQMASNPCSGFLITLLANWSKTSLFGVFLSADWCPFHLVMHHNARFALGKCSQLVNVSCS